jgi:uncharacterized protein (TIGR02246 family)
VRKEGYYDEYERSMNMLSWGYVAPMALVVCLGTVYAASVNEEDERTIRGMVDQAVTRLNKGDVSALEDFWDENADYVGVDGTLIKGRAQMQAFFRKMAESSKGRQIATVDQIRFVTRDLATVDGSWTVTGAKGADGKEFAPIKGRGFEVVQKRNGRWRFIATREMVIFKGN